MSETTLRLILRTPHTTQVGNEEWVDATYHHTAEVRCDAVLEKLLESGSIVIGAELTGKVDSQS